MASRGGVLEARDAAADLRDRPQNDLDHAGAG